MENNSFAYSSIRKRDSNTVLSTPSSSSFSSVSSSSLKQHDRSVQSSLVSQTKDFDGNARFNKKQRTAGAAVSNSSMMDQDENQGNFATIERVIEILEKERSDSQETISKLKQDHAEAVEKEREMRRNAERELDAANKTIEILKRQGDGLVFISEKDKELKKYLQSGKQLQQQQMNTDDSILNTRLNELTVRVTKAESEAKKYQIELRLLKEEANKVQILEVLNGDLTSQLEKIRQDTIDQSEAITRVQFLENRLQEWQKVCDRLFASSYESNSRKLEITPETTLSEIGKLQKKMRTQEEYIRSYSIEAEKYKKKYENLSSEMQEIQEELEKKSKEGEELKTNITKLKSQLKQVEAENKGNVSSLQFLKSFQGDNGNENKKINELKKKLEEVEMEKNEAVQACNALEDKLCELNSIETFNPESMKVLHMKDNPASRHRREKKEILAAMVSSSSSSMDQHMLAPLSVAASESNPDVYRVRMKEYFKKAINTYKDVVCDMTGFNVTKLNSVNGYDRYKFQPVYAPNEEDYLLVQVKCKEETGNVETIELIETEFSKTLDDSITAYLRKGSFPGFLANIIIDLFDKTTVKQ